MARVPEVIDCWFDSGAMPFAQYHWPFENGKKPKLFPADYIAEGIDQTRGWFYTLLAISTLMGFGPSYKNVISLGHVLDEKGEKMSKSRGNVVDPWYIVRKYGADTTRWYFFTINQPWDPKLFSEKDVSEALKRFILTFWNCYLFFETYGKKKEKALPKSKNVLDRWIVSRLENLIKETTENLEKYDITKAAREIEKFVVEDLSLWYIRRSRRRFQRPEDKKELKEGSQTLKFVLLNLSKILAPFLPFLSELVYQRISTFSVHLADWPKVNEKLIDKKLERKMEKVREIVSLALAERQKAKIKVRQPLQKLEITDYRLKKEKELLELIKEEVNVKEISFGREFKLDTKITPELKEEGMVREIIRHIQEMRKEMKLKPKDKILVGYSGSENISKILEENKEKILKEGKILDLKPKEGKFDLEREIKVDDKKIILAIKKINGKHSSAKDAKT
jgi:isoleucyl-tRNA synthetase